MIPAAAPRAQGRAVARDQWHRGRRARPDRAAAAGGKAGACPGAAGGQGCDRARIPRIRPSSVRGAMPPSKIRAIIPIDGVMSQ